MNVETCLDGIRYTLTNDGLKVSDKVYPIANGRRLDNEGWILHDIDFDSLVSGFPNEPHTIKEMKKNKNGKLYEIITDYGYSAAQCYYKVIKKEKQVVVNPDAMFLSYKWIEIE